MSGISFDPNKIISGNNGKNSSGINFDPNKIISGGDPNPEYVAADKKVQQKAITTSDSLKNLREDFSAKYLTSPTTQSAAKNLTEIPSYVKSKTTIPSADYDAGYAKQVQLAKEMSEAKRQYETAKANDERTITMKVLDGIGGVSNSVSDAKAKYEAKKKEYEQYKGMQYYSSLPDGEAKTTSTKNSLNYLTDNTVDWRHEYINNFNNFRDVYQPANLRKDDSYKKYSYMTEREIGIYNYLYNKNKDKAEEFLEFIDDDLEARKTQETVEKAYDFSNKHPILGSIGSVGATIASSQEQTENNFNYLMTGEMKENVTSRVGSALRGAVTDKVNWEISNWDAFDFIYNTGMSAADSLVAAATGDAGAVILGLSAAASASNDIIDRGGTNEQAFWGGLASGVFEGFFEEFSISQLKAMQEGAVSGFKDFAKNVGKSMITNASEETATEIANVLYDYAANGGISQYSALVQEYISAGENEATAKKKAAQKLGLQIVEAGASGALMGVGFGSLGSAAAYQNYKKSGNKEFITLEEFANRDSEIWRNVDYFDNDTKTAIMNETHNRMVVEGNVVKVSKETQEKVGESFPDLRSMKKKERTPILKEAMDTLKNNLRQFLNGLKNQSFEFEVNGKVLEATLYNTGINEVLEKITQEKANMLYSTDEIFKNSCYLYSTPDYEGDPNVYRWNFFYTPVQIGEETVGVRIAVRDLAKQGESQIYNWGIKKDVSLDGVGDGLKNRKSNGVSSDTSNEVSQTADAESPSATPYSENANTSSDTTVPQNGSGVNNNISTWKGNNSQNSKASNIVDEGGERKVFGTKDGKRHHVTAKEQNYIRKISNALGFSNDKIIFEHMDKTLGFLADGYYNKKDGTLHIGYSVIDPVTFIFKHELTHFGEGTEQYTKFVKAVENSTAFKNWLEARYPELKDKNIEKLIGRYRQEVMDSRAKVAPLKPAEAHAEMIADFVGDILFTEDGSGLESLLSSLDYKERNAVVQYILDFLSYLKKKLAGNKELVFEISRLEDNFNRAISEATATKKFPTNGGGVQFIVNQENNSSIKQQLAEHKDEINAIGVVFNQRISAELNSKQEAVEWVISRLGNDVNTVKREGFGEIVLDKKRIKNGMSYLKTKEEIFAFAAVPQVLKKGIEIASHSNHKGRSYDTITFAAPVVINAQRGNMAVVVREEDKNYYKVHRLLMPDGSQFIFDEKRDTAETAGGVDNNSGLSPTDNVSTDSIPDNQETVNNSSMHESGNNSKNNLQFSFARVYDMSLIKQAEQMEERLKAENKSENEIRKEIWKKIGLIRDTGDVWVYEIDDSKIEFSPYGDALNELSPKVKEFYKLADLGRKTPEKRERYNQLREKYGSPFFRKGKLKDFLKHDALFEKYPQLKETNVEFKMISGPAQYNPETDTIEINAERLLKKNGLKGLDKQIEELVREIEFEDTMVHEIQHAIQHDDKRENGSNVEFWKARLLRGERLPINTETGEEFTPYDAYMATKGEYEARESKNRKNLNEQERREKVPDLGWGKTISARETANAKNLEFSIPTDTEYMLAVESGDMDTAQWLTDSAAKAAGYTERLYHQTGADFTEFNTNNQKAGKYDWELPTGTFLKPTDNDIGLKGKKQMELYAKFQNPLTFENRKEARKFWSDNVDGYSEAAKEIQKLNAEYRTKVDEAEADTREYLKKWRRNNPDKDSREIYKDTEYQRLNDIEDGIVDEWEEKDDELSLRAKELINGFISKNDYDGIIVEKDVGSYGRYTKTYIAFESAQMKSAEAVTYDDNGDVIPLSERFNIEQSDIRYSIPTDASTLLDKYESGEISREEYQEQLDELWGQAIGKYGAIEQGENAKEPISIPQKVDENKNTERFIRTVIETGKLTPEMVNNIEQEILLGDIYSYEVISDENVQKKADRYFEKGIAEDEWSAAVNNRAMTKDDIAIGEKLLLQAIESDNRMRVLELSSELADALTRAGQTVQAARMLKKMSGIEKLMTVQRNVKTINKDLEQKYGDKAVTVKLDPVLAGQLAKCKNLDDIEIVYKDVLRDVAAQVPSTWLDKLNAWRYFAMLANPKTYIRNIVGNGVFGSTVLLKDAIATGAERIIIRDTSKRTKAIFIKQEYKDFAKQDIKSREAKNMLEGKGQLDEKGMINELRRTFEHDFLENITTGNSNLLEAQDMWFKSRHYKVALASFLQARKVDLNNISDKTLQEAREYAVNEAKKATFQDASALANWLNNIKNPIGKIAVEGVLPFKRTPINIIKRGIEYSPLGLVETTAKALWQVKKGEFSVSEFCDGLAAGLTGTGVMLLGCFLSSLGWVTGGFGDDEEDKFRELNGEQEYSVQIFGKSYSIEWAAPACLPFFMGVELSKQVGDNNDGLQYKDVTEMAWHTLEPITNLSMLSGVQGLIDAVKYEDSSKTIGAMAGDIATSFAMQFVPSFFGATSRTIDSTQRKWYTDKNSSLDSFTQSAINNVKSKIPGLSYTQIPSIDAWGREKSRGNVGERLLENFISPGYYSEVEYDEVNKELQRVFIKTGGKVLPKTAAKSFEVDGEIKNLTADEWVSFAKAKGVYSFDYIKEFLDSSAYKNLTDEERAEVIEGLYEYSNAKAKCEVSDYDITKRYKTVTEREQNGGSAVDYYISQAISK